MPLSRDKDATGIVADEHLEGKGEALRAEKELRVAEHPLVRAFGMEDVHPSEARGSNRGRCRMVPNLEGGWRRSKAVTRTLPHC